MIGLVRFRKGDSPEIVVTMEDDGRWTCPDLPELATGLNVTMNPHEGRSPADGVPGYRQLNQLAQMLGGTVEFAERPDERPGTIY